MTGTLWPLGPVGRHLFNVALIRDALTAYTRIC